jgi:nucleoside-diphosphate-sugar epimerase
MLKNIAVFGASGFFGLPVTKALANAGFTVYVLSTDVDAERAILPENVIVEEGNWMYHHDLKRFLKKVDAIYCCLSVDLNEKPEDFHAETDGLREILNASLECGIRRIAYMSSILQYNQVENEESWWVFRVKKDAVNYVRDCGIPFTIFYPSTFMESFQSTYRKGKSVKVYGQSGFPIYFISLQDYARMVVNAFKIATTQDKEYFVQGADCYKMQEAAKIYVRHQKGIKLKQVGLNWIRLLSLFSDANKFIYELSLALNDNNEQFVAEDTWAELGKPEISFNAFAKSSE